MPVVLASKLVFLIETKLFLDVHSDWTGLQHISIQACHTMTRAI